MRAETLAILRESRATAIVVTHDAEEAMRMGDRIALLKDGRLVQAGRAEELYLQARRPVRRRLLFRAQRLRGAGPRRRGRDAGRQGRRRRASPKARRRRSPCAWRASTSAKRPARSRRASCRGAISASSNCSNWPFRAPKRRSARGYAAALCPPGARDIWLSLRKSDVLVFETRRRKRIDQSSEKQFERELQWVPFQYGTG